MKQVGLGTHSVQFTKGWFLFFKPRIPIRHLIAMVALLLAALVAPAAGLEDRITGVFSNEEEGFKIMTLIVHKDGVGYFHAAIAGQIGEWKFNKGESVLSFTLFDESSGKGETVRLKFDHQNRSYTLIGSEKDATPTDNILHFVTNQIPDELVLAFKNYPDHIKKVRRRVQTEQEWMKRGQEKLERERPEYEQTLSRIKANPKSVLSKKFYTRDVTPAIRALQASLKDSEINYPEEVLIGLLEQLPEHSHYIRELIFARRELSAGTIERFYPKALVWGRRMNLEILANIATHSNTPIAIIRDLAGHDELPTGATTPAKQRLSKMDAGLKKQ